MKNCEVFLWGYLIFLKGSSPKVVKEIPIYNIDDDANSMLRVFDNGQTFLLTEWFPWEGCSITEEMITKEFASALGVRIIRED